MTIEELNALFPPKPETPEWLVWLGFAACIALLIAFEAFKMHREYSLIREAVQHVFHGKSLDNVNVALKGVAPEDFCKPLPKATLRRIQHRRQTEQAQVSVSLANPLPLLVNEAKLDVTYRFQGEGLEVNESAQLRVSFYRRRGMLEPVCVYAIEVVQPRDDGDDEE